jgi:hypothetical protein
MQKERDYKYYGLYKHFEIKNKIQNKLLYKADLVNCTDK